MELSARIERVYMALEAKRAPRGARAWFARQAKVAPYTVSRWISGERGFQGSPVSVLELLEHRAGISHPDPAATTQ